MGKEKTETAIGQAKLPDWLKDRPDLEADDVLEFYFNEGKLESQHRLALLAGFIPVAVLGIVLIFNLPIGYTAMFGKTESERLEAQGSLGSGTNLLMAFIGGSATGAGSVAALSMSRKARRGTSPLPMPLPRTDASNDSPVEGEPSPDSGPPKPQQEQEQEPQPAPVVQQQPPELGLREERREEPEIKPWVEPEQPSDGPVQFRRQAGFRYDHAQSDDTIARLRDLVLSELDSDANLFGSSGQVQSYRASGRVSERGDIRA